MVENLQVEYSESSGYSFTFPSIIVTLLLGRTIIFLKKEN